MINDDIYVFNELNMAGSMTSSSDKHRYFCTCSIYMEMVNAHTCILMWHLTFVASSSDYKVGIKLLDIRFDIFVNFREDMRTQMTDGDPSSCGYAVLKRNKGFIRMNIILAEDARIESIKFGIPADTKLESVKKVMNGLKISRCSKVEGENACELCGAIDVTDADMESKSTSVICQGSADMVPASFITILGDKDNTVMMFCEIEVRGMKNKPLPDKVQTDNTGDNIDKTADKPNIHQNDKLNTSEKTLRTIEVPATLESRVANANYVVPCLSVGVPILWYFS